MGQREIIANSARISERSRLELTDQSLAAGLVDIPADQGNTSNPEERAVNNQGVPHATCSEDEEPLVTAVLVCWNHVRFVRGAVLSALNQTYNNIELLVFDNGSTDGSRQELEKMASEYGFGLVCHAQNMGLTHVLNQGLSMAHGKYFATLATDDVWLSEKVERQVGFLQTNNDVHMLSGQMETIDDNGVRNGIPVTRRPGEVTFVDLMRNGCNVAGPTVMCRTETLREMGGYDTKIRVEDYTMALRFADKGYRIVNVDEVWTLYREHGGNWTSRPIWAEALEIGLQFRSSPEYRSFVRVNLRGYFRHLAGHRKRDALRLIRQQPIAWTWNDVGVGIIKLLTPSHVLRLTKHLGKFVNG